MGNDVRQRFGTLAIPVWIVVSNAALFMWHVQAIAFAGGQAPTRMEYVFYFLPFPAAWVAASSLIGFSAGRPPVAETALATGWIYWLRILLAESWSSRVQWLSWFVLMWVLSFLIAEAARRLRAAMNRYRTGTTSSGRTASDT